MTPTARKSPSYLRKSPSQARSRATVDAILEAAARILVQKGYEALTTNAVAEIAGVSIGSLYQYFPHKAALIAALSKRHLDDIQTTLDQGLEQIGAMPFRDLVHAMIEANVAAHLFDPGLHGALSDHLPHQGAQDWRVIFEKRAHAGVRALLEAHRDVLKVRDLDLAAYVVMRSVEACVHGAYRDRRVDMKSGALARAVSEMVLGYLT